MSSANEYINVVNSRTLKRNAITSYSVLVHTLIDGEILYLLGRIRDTIPFKEFIRCNIRDSDIPRYIHSMSKEEKYRLLTEPFRELLDDVIVNHSSKAYKYSCDVEDKFQVNLQKFNHLLLSPSIGLPHAPWIFPKGRKQEKESDLAAALREFEEETHIPSAHIRVYNTNPLEETYYGLDGQLYKTIYFVGFLDYKIFETLGHVIRSQYVVTHKRTTLSEEISKIKWLSYQDSITILDKAKQFVLRITDIFLLNKLIRGAPDRRHSM